MYYPIAQAVLRSGASPKIQCACRPASGVHASSCRAQRRLAPPQCLQGAYAARLRLTGKGLQRSASSIRCDKLPGGPPGRYGPSSPSTSPNESRHCGPIQPQTKMAGRIPAGTDLPRSPRGRASAGSRGRFEDRHRWGFVMAFSRTDLYDAAPMRCGFVCQSSLFQTDELHIRGFTSLPPCGPSRARPTGSPDRWPHLIIRCGARMPGLTRPSVWI